MINPMQIFANFNFMDVLGLALFIQFMNIGFSIQDNFWYWYLVKYKKLEPDFEHRYCLECEKWNNLHFK